MFMYMYVYMVMYVYMYMWKGWKRGYHIVLYMFWVVSALEMVERYFQSDQYDEQDVVTWS